ncbi:MAG TPA: hypothetical protein PKC30_05285 [Saprospiraceae bacterium]|nr:hypothetical protein [Saprospiraceae bacterium]
MGKPVEKPDILKKYARWIDETSDDESLIDKNLLGLYDELIDPSLKGFLDDLLIVLAVLITASTLLFVWVIGQYWGLTIPFFYFAVWYIYQFDVKMMMESIADKEVLPDDSQLMFNELRKARDIRFRRLIFTIFTYSVFFTLGLIMTGMTFFAKSISTSSIILMGFLCSGIFNVLIFRKSVFRYILLDRRFKLIRDQQE